MVDEDIQEAASRAIEFIDMGASNKGASPNRPALMDWEQDADLIIPAVNRVAGQEIRSIDYMHWWTFMGYYNEIGQCAFSTVVAIRDKRARGKKLDAWEKDFFKENMGTVILKRKLTAEEELKEKQDEEELKKLLGE